MAPYGTVTGQFKNKLGEMMCKIRPVGGKIYVFAENTGNYGIGSHVEYETTGHGKGIDFAQITGPATWKPEVRAPVHAPEKEIVAPSTRDVLFYGSPDQFRDVQKRLSLDHHVDSGMFETVSDFFYTMNLCQQRGFGCVVLDNLEIPLGKYTAGDQRNVRHVLSRVENRNLVRGGAIVVEACVNIYGLPVLVNRLFNGDYEFLRSVSRVAVFPTSLDDQISAILKKRIK